MLHVKIKELVLAYGHPQPAKWLMAYCGMRSNKEYNIQKGNQKTLVLDDIALICEKLDCLPNELLYWKQTPGHTLPQGQIMAESPTPLSSVTLTPPA